MLTRIGMFLMFTSASLVSLALVGQATTFSDMFMVLAGVVLFVDVVIGCLSQVRVFNVAYEDLMYVLAMNRPRSAYVALDPGISRHFMTSVHDDLPGSVQTYDSLGSLNPLSHVAGSSMTFISTANSALIAILAGLLTSIFGTGVSGAAAVGASVRTGFFHRFVGLRLQDVYGSLAPIHACVPHSPGKSLSLVRGSVPGRFQSMAAMSSTTRSRKASTCVSS
ncbi:MULTISPECIES: hypothetical protein [unclassified Arthrobacter]|uniref:hypothetical protein n=1 Tax=unclassified Pseudarthrobacter TaxID=2647000 RepID=UPI003392D432